MKKELICISCPQGCALEVEYDETSIIKVEGAQCKRGQAYAESEVFHPTRMVTTTICINGACIPLIPIKTSGAVSRDLTMDIVRRAAKLRVPAPVRCGDVVLANVLDTGVNLVATRTLEAE